MGRDPKPATIKILSGNPSKRKPNAGPSSKLADPATKPPAHLNREAKSIWREKIAQLVNDGTLAVSDLDTLSRYCEAVATEREATRQLDANGYVVATEQGIYPNPWVKIRTDAASRAAKASAALGIGQLNRQKLTPIVSDTGVNSLEAFQRKYG